MPARDARPSFNTGEISEDADARFDLSKFSAGCEVLENFMPMPTGGARKRPGFVYAAETKNSGASEGRVIPFRFSTGTNFILLFEAGTIRFFSNREAVMDGGVAYEVATPYTEAQLFQIHHLQINDVVYFTHPDVAPQKLSRLGDTNWTFEEVDWDSPPFLTQNLNTDVTVYPSATSGTGVTLTATAPAWATTTAYVAGEDFVLSGGVIYKCLTSHTSDASDFATDNVLGYWELVEVFKSTNVGGFFQVSQPRLSTTSQISNLNSGSATSTNITASGSVRLFTTGTWDGELTLERSRDGGTTWDDILIWTSASDFNGETSINFPDEVTLRWNYVRSLSPSSAFNPRAVIDVANSTTRDGYGKITAVASSVSATIDVVSSFESSGSGNAEYTWAEGAWSSRRGFPRTVAIHEQRVSYAGTSTKAQTVWLSGTDDYDNFAPGTLADSPFSVTIGSRNYNGIQWMQSKKDLILGTTGGEFAIKPASDSSPLGPTNVSIQNDTNYGSDTVQPVLVNESVLYIARANSAVMELSYSFASQEYVSPDLTLLSSHIIRPGVRQMDVQMGRWATLWAATLNGYVAGMTYERTQDVVAWFRMTTATGDTIESVATIYGETDDEVWAVIKRAKGDGSGYVRTVEYLDTGAWAAQDDRDVSGSAFLDCATVYSGAAATSITIPSFLVGRTLKLLVDGAVFPDVTPDSTTVAIGTSATNIVAGLSYEAKLQPTRPEAQLGNGSSSGTKKRIATVAVKLKDSGYLNIYKAGDDDRSKPVLVTAHNIGEEAGSPPDLITDVKRRAIPGTWQYEPAYLLISDSPLPCTVLGLAHEFVIGQRS